MIRRAHRSDPEFERKFVESGFDTQYNIAVTVDHRDEEVVEAWKEGPEALVKLMLDEEWLKKKVLIVLDGANRRRLSIAHNYVMCAHLFLPTMPDYVRYRLALESNDKSQTNNTTDLYDKLTTVMSLKAQEYSVAQIHALVPDDWGKVGRISQFNQMCDGIIHKEVLKRVDTEFATGKKSRFVNSMLLDAWFRKMTPQGRCDMMDWITVNIKQIDADETSGVKSPLFPGAKWGMEANMKLHCVLFWLRDEMRQILSEAAALNSKEEQRQNELKVQVAAGEQDDALLRAAELFAEAQKAKSTNPDAKAIPVYSKTHKTFRYSLKGLCDSWLTDGQEALALLEDEGDDALEVHPNDRLNSYVHDNKVYIRSHIKGDTTEPSTWDSINELLQQAMAIDSPGLPRVFWVSSPPWGKLTGAAEKWVPN